MGNTLDFESDTDSSNLSPRSIKRKNTRKWCRGKKGVKHETEWITWNAFKRVSYLGGWEIEVCKNCGKSLKWRRAAEVKR